MAHIKKVFLYSLLVIITAGYCWFIELALGAFRLLLANYKYTCWPNLTEVLAIHPLPWQILAVMSLLANSLLAFLWKKEASSFEKHLAGAFCHVCWIVICFFLHGIGMLEPFIFRVYVLE